MRYVIQIVAITLMFAKPALSGPIADFNSSYSALQTKFRFALLLVASRNPEKSSSAMQSLARKWEVVHERYGDTPPPHLAEDALWTQTMTQVDQALTSAQMSAWAGDFAETRRAMISIQTLLTQMHRRNGIVTDSDRIEAYRTRMGQILRLDLSSPDAIGLVREHAAVLEHLADDLVMAPLPKPVKPVENKKMIEALTASVQALIEAARQGDLLAIKSARDGLLKPYSRLVMLRG